MLFPFLPFMVSFLLPNVPNTAVAKYAGYVASAVFAGRFVGCYIWGAIADYMGRKPVLIASGVLLAVSTFVFGFSINYEMAIVFRFLIGVSNGVAVAARAAISDTSTDSNQALGLSLLSCAWGVGLVIGPALSGLTADPITQYSLTLESGLGFSAKEIGLSLAVAGGVLLPIGLVLYPLLERKFRSINTFHMNAIPFMVMIVLFPLIYQVRISATKHLSICQLYNTKPRLKILTELLWVILIASLVVYNVTDATIFSATSLLINNSVTKDKLGSVNGLAMSSTSLVRAAATSFTGGIYSLSLSEQHMKFGYPIDYHLTFIIFGFIVLLVIFVVAALPESINNHMKEEDVLKYDIMHVISCPPRCSKHCYFA
eukprot:Em0017g408a